MVRKGFGLADIKALYIDEMHEYYCELVQVMEISNEVKEGSYDLARGVDRSSENLSALFNFAKK